MIKSRGYEWFMLMVSLAYLVNIIVCAHFEDKVFITSSEEVVVGYLKPPEFFMVFDIITLVVMGFYVVDNMAYACTYGLKKKIRIYHLSFETLLITVIIAFKIIELNDVNIRFRAFYFRLLDILLIQRKLSVT